MPDPAGPDDAASSATGPPALDPATVDPDPLVQVGRWLAAAVVAGGPDPTAAVLATVDDDGGPDARFVLVKGLDHRGARFFTNLGSAKARQLRARPVAALVLRWPDPHRQVRLRGPVAVVADDEADAYFATRPRGSRLGAWASPQSTPLADRAELDRRLDEVAVRFAGAEVPRPPGWGGFRLVPDRVELWQGRPDRLHDRVRYDRRPDGSWGRTRLAP